MTVHILKEDGQFYCNNQIDLYLTIKVVDGWWPGDPTCKSCILMYFNNTELVKTSDMEDLEKFGKIEKYG